MNIDNVQRLMSEVRIADAGLRTTYSNALLSPSDMSCRRDFNLALIRRDGTIGAVTRHIDHIYNARRKILESF